MENFSGKTDEELASLCAGGSKDAADFLLEKYKPCVRSMSRARFLIGGDTDDLIQEGMIGLYKAIRDYDPNKEASFRTFAVLCIARQQNTAIESSNRNKNRPLNSYVSLSDEEWETAFAKMKEDSPEKIVIDREATDEAMRRIREALSPMERRVLDLYLQDHDYQEIAKIMQKEPKAIDNALQRIRAKVRKVF